MSDARRTHAIAQAIREELLMFADQINGSDTLRAITFEVKLVPGTATIRTVILRPEYEHVFDRKPENGR